MAPRFLYRGVLVATFAMGGFISQTGSATSAAYCHDATFRNLRTD
jgi:hypothetical protein